MAITVTASGVEFGYHELEYDEFNDMCALHLRHVPGTQRLEATAKGLAAAGFPAEQVIPFVQAVCFWGGPTGNRVLSKVLSGSQSGRLKDGLERAWSALDKHHLDDALAAVNGIYGLGGLSYATKHLRFLRPDLCPVLDSNVQNALGYSSYSQLGEDYQVVAGKLRDHHVSNPMGRFHGAWFVGDVDMAIFAYLVYSGRVSARNGDAAKGDVKMTTKKDGAKLSFDEAERRATEYASRNRWVGSRSRACNDRVSGGGAYLINFSNTYVAVLLTGECRSDRSWRNLRGVADSTGRTLGEVFPAAYRPEARFPDGFRIE